ncbi:hypothetical protein G4B88_030812 [Cannabis sativa]|uniref:Uncharacterized protein n=1 Tax=Cannabis sativa TaxID=3483 RepID=A0A7J6FM37_CANSA|nr:hypothetical protein G4B88_030812 [Cannabis sativa]
MSLSVVRSSESLVKPREKTPCTTLELSAMDKVPVLRCNARTLHVYKKGGKGAASAIREALSRALVPYYPLAGRLKEYSSPNPNIGLQVDCCGEGVWFVDASADSKLEHFNYFDDLIDASNYSVSSSHDHLLPNQIRGSLLGDQPLVQIQVTRFACDGFVMGLVFSHIICDGLGAAQFLNAVGEFARGFDRLTVDPVWCRDFFLTNNTTTSTPQPLPTIMPFVNYKLKEAHVDISMEQIEKLKQHFQQSTGGAHKCSTFEIVAASFWSCRTKAITITNYNSNDDVEEEMVRLVFFANCRQLMQPPLPEGFYGNCFFPVTIKASKKFVANASVVEVVKMIQQGKAKLGEEFDNYRKSRNENDGMEEEREDPFMQPLSYNTLFVSEWGRLGFNQVDMGWGQPLHIVPIQGSAIIPAGIVGWQPAPKRGIRLMSWCVEEPHRHLFLSHIMRLFTI